MVYRNVKIRITSMVLILAMLLSYIPVTAWTIHASAEEFSTESVVTTIPARNIVQNYPSYIGDSYSVADLMLPSSVNVQKTDGSIVSASVTWDYTGLDLSKLGTYTLTGVVDGTELTVQQVVHVVAYQNLMLESSFEED